MEKGNARSSSSKANSSDLKNKQDGNKYNRYARYKQESISPRPDARSKPHPQKSRESFDKRPRARSGAICERYRNKVAAVDMFPEGTNRGLKKVNLNHLLNFTLPPIDGGGSSREFYGRQQNWGYRAKMHKYCKEQFLQANCQFIVREDGDYSQHCRNPDLLVHWSSIEEVRVPTHEVPSCPICLYPPVAAKITRCGHIYCWPCILHYLNLTDKSWQKCPICFEAIHADDLKSVLPQPKKLISVANKISMCLMKREKGCMFAVPAIYDSCDSVVRMHDVEWITRYQKLLLATKDEVNQILYRERKELETQLMSEENEPEACFIERALELLSKRELQLNTDRCNVSDESREICDTQNLPTDDKADFATQVLDENISNIDCDSFHESAELIAYNAHSEDPSMVCSSPVLHEIGSQDCVKGKGTFYFYQAEDGQHIYLNGLNVRMLIKEFGSLEDSPPLVEGKVLELEKISMTEVLRKRLRYLQHIPLTCEFQVAELNIDHLISKPTVQEFSAEVAKRQKLRNHKAHEERKREKYIQEIENKKMGKYPSATYNINSHAQFPICHSYAPETENDTGNYETQYPCFGISTLSLDENLEKSSPPSTSFAQMLRGGQVMFSSKSPMQTQTLAEIKDRARHDCEDSDEEAMAVPEYRQSFSTAIQAAIDTAINEQKNGDVSSKKKKKVKSRVLFTTSMCRSK